MSRSETKANRLLQIEALLLAHPEGMTQAEIARKLQVDRSTIGRYIPDLPGHVYIDDLDGHRWKIDREGYLVHVRFNLHEALAVHLATRLLATRMDRQNPHAAAALRKLGISLERLAPRISTHVKQSADVMDDAARRHDPHYLQVLEKLALAWAEERKVEIWHRYEPTGAVYRYKFSPYFIEPYAVGQSTHAIGWREPPEAIRTFKIERIERIDLLADRYTIPADFDPRQILADAWGIWYTEEEPQHIVLRFSPKVANRVRESSWHKSQQLIDEPDGSLLWLAEVAEPKEMLNWVRGWGADCEVLEPEGLRKTLVREARKLAELYAVMGVEKKTQFYAHTKDGVDESEWQLLIDHLNNTASIAQKLGKDIGISDFSYIVGMLHDIGKYSKEFQARLFGSSKKVDHATAGAQLIVEQVNASPAQKIVSMLLAYCIAGHHTGLLDFGSVIDTADDVTLQARLKRSVKDYSAFSTEIDLAAIDFLAQLPIEPITHDIGYSLAFFTRMVYSTLVDADFMDTEIFVNPTKTARGGYPDIDDLYIQLSEYLHQFDYPDNPINQERTNTLKQCITQAEQAPGLFSLTVPTGSGKTLSSLAFAMRHAQLHGMKRIIYVIPFTSIIEQNAAVFKSVLGNNNVLEHHSNFDWKQLQKMKSEDADDSTLMISEKLKLATENWDIPIVVTTNVQFFESLYANRSSASRKVHNMGNSAIIFDEAQMIPRGYMEPCLYAVYELVHNYNSTAIFCTATQPPISRFLPAKANIHEITPEPKALYDFYKRVDVKSIGKIPDDELIEMIDAHPQALCIVNTRKHAKGLFEYLDTEGRYHLSTLMCPAHRKQTIAEIRVRLKAGKACRVVSTQIMEAGIDVDFPVGFRTLAGIDSIVQAAGRVNREARNTTGNLYVFEPDSEFIKRTPIYIRQTADVAQSILRDYKDPISIEAVTAYYDMLYDLQADHAFDEKRILDCFMKGQPQEPNFDFKTASERFKLIESPTVSVVIPFNEQADTLLQQSRYTPYPYQYSRQLQVYTVNIYEQEFNALNTRGLIEYYGDAYAVLNDMDYYDLNTGLIIPDTAGGEAIFFDG